MVESDGRDRTKYWKQQYQKNKEKNKERSKKWKIKHRDRCREQAKKYYREHPEKFKSNWKKYQDKLKTQAYAILGNKCKICGYSGLALQIDHIHNNGVEERKKFKIGNGISTSYRITIYKKIISGSSEYQLLCANCNVEKEILRRKTK